jgi:hypothetical protein
VKTEENGEGEVVGEGESPWAWQGVNLGAKVGEKL